MKELTSKQIKNYILDYEDLNKIEKFLEIDFKETVEGIMNALYILSKNYDKNKNIINSLINILKEELETKNTEELHLLIGPIIDYQNKISKFPIKERIKIKDITLEIQNIFNEIQIKTINEEHTEQIKILEFLILYDKNISMIERYINENKNILSIKNENGDNILSIILKKYVCSIDENEKNYLYYIILIFLNSKLEKDILKDKDQYLKTIQNCKEAYSENNKKISKILHSESNITKEELEEKYGIHFDFPNAILNEVKTFNMQEKNRTDFTTQECITIDGKTSECLDDAIYIEKNIDNTYTLYIHITDIPSFVPFSSITREEASLRSKTLYLSDTNILLYPSDISNLECSLLTNNVKNTISYIIKLDENYKTIPDTFQITLGKIKVAHRLTYEDADARICNPDESKLDNILINLANFATTRRKENRKKELYREYENIIHEESHHESLRINYSEAANIVHESMVLINHEVAKYFKKLSLPYIYRKLNIPSNDFIKEQVDKLNHLGANLEQDKAFLNSLKDSYIESIYCSNPSYHKGLELDCYSHSTSPGRRYIDSLGQYIIHDLLIDKNMNDNNLYAWEYRIDRAIQHTNERIKQNEIFEKEYNYLSHKKLIKEK